MYNLGVIAADTMWDINLLAIPRFVRISILQYSISHKTCTWFSCYLFCFVYINDLGGFAWFTLFIRVTPMALRQWASYQIRKIAGCACAGNAGNVFPTHRLQRKPLVSDPGMHQGTCVTQVPWCMSESLTWGNGENVSGICAPAILRIWQEANCKIALVPVKCPSRMWFRFNVQIETK